MTKNIEITELLDIYGKLLTDRQKQITEDYYNFDLSLGEIADNCGITRQAARDALKSAENSLLKYESILGLRQVKLKILKVINEQISTDEKLEIITNLYKLV